MLLTLLTELTELTVLTVLTVLTAGPTPFGSPEPPGSAEPAHARCESRGTVMGVMGQGCQWKGGLNKRTAVGTVVLCTMHSLHASGATWPWHVWWIHQPVQQAVSKPK